MPIDEENNYKKYKSNSVNANGFNPIFKNFTCKFEIRAIDYAFIIFTVFNSSFNEYSREILG